MKILFVVGGSYKAFYLNNAGRYKKLDLLIFQSNILYECDYFNEFSKEKTITNEMMILQRKFNTKIIAIINTNLLGKKHKEYLYCDENGVRILNGDEKIILYVKKKKFCITNKPCYQPRNICYLIGGDKNLQNKCVKIIRKGFVCTNRCVILVNNGRIIKKFRKICYFSLKF